MRVLFYLTIIYLFAILKRFAETKHQLERRRIMAQVIGYHENNVVFTEGPFVICNPMGNGWRIEVELKRHHCPVLPDASIYPIQKQFGLDGKTWNQSLAERVCDRLNQMVQDSLIILVGDQWMCATQPAMC